MNDILANINKSLTEYYQTRHQSFSESSQQVGWKSVEAQQRRFDQLLKVVDKDAASLNDFGCGHGDLALYAEKKGLKDVDYHGYDMFRGMVDKAIDMYGENARRKFVHISQPGEMREADYTVASGVLNIRFGISDEDWLKYIHEMITLFNARSKKGFAFNALTSYSDREYMRPELYYTDPCKLFDFCKRTFSRNVALLHDYDEYDFTIIVRK